MMVWISVESVVISLYRFILHPFGCSLFSFLPVWLVVYFVDLFEKPALGFIDFLKGFSCLYFLRFCSDLSYFLSSASFWVFLSLSTSSFKFDDMVSILDFSFLLMWAFIVINFPLDTALNVSQILVCCVFVLVGFEEHLYFCLHFIVYPADIQEPVVQFPWSFAVLS